MKNSTHFIQNNSLCLNIFKCYFSILEIGKYINVINNISLIVNNPKYSLLNKYFPKILITNFSTLLYFP